MAVSWSELEEDERFAYIQNVIQLSFGIDEDLWIKFIEQEKPQSTIKSFFDEPTSMTIIIYLQGGSLVIAEEIQSPAPKRSIYFMKHSETDIPLTDFKHLFACIPIYDSPLQDYLNIFEKVLSPVLCNPMNHSGWPYEMFNDVKSHVHDFCQIINYHIGDAKQRTLLVIPDSAKKIADMDVTNLTSSSLEDLQVCYVLDSIGLMLTDWTALIAYVLQPPPEENTGVTELDGPLSIIEYWKNRKENLRFILQQLDEPVVKEMALALENTNSPNLETFKRLLRDVVEALAEADDISNNLEAMVEPLQLLSTHFFGDIQHLLPDIMNDITQAWMQSKPFRSTPSEIRILVQKICNLLIHRSKKFLNGAEIFSEDRDMCHERVIKVKNVLNTFIEAYNMCRESITSPFEHVKVYPWEYPDERVFGQLKWFYTRLEDIEKLFNTVEIYDEIPTYELFTSYHLPLKKQLNNIYAKFKEMYTVLISDGKGDPLDPQNIVFSDYLSVFWKGMENLDRQFGAAIGQGCLACPIMSQAFKLTRVFSNPLSRPVLLKEFKIFLPALIDKAKQNIFQASEVCEEQVEVVSRSGFSDVHQLKLPPLSCVGHWAFQMEDMLSELVKLLKDIQLSYEVDEDLQPIYRKQEKLIESIETFIQDEISKWEAEVISDVEVSLAQNVIEKLETGKIKVNFDLKISRVAQEVESLMKIGKTFRIPRHAKMLYDTYSEIRCCQAYLTETVQWYNKLHDDLTDIERILLAEKWENAESILHDGLAFHWRSEGVHYFAVSAYSAMEDLFNDVHSTKENIEEVKQMIAGWSSVPLYCRKTPEDPVDFRIYGTAELRERYNLIKKTSEKMREKLEENIDLFDCDYTCDAWHSYVKGVDMIMEEGLKDACAISLKYLLDNTNPDNKKMAPYVVVNVRLDANDMIFEPPLDRSEPGCLVNCIQGATAKIFAMGAQINHLTLESMNYETGLLAVSGLISMKSNIIENVAEASLKALELTNHLHRYEFFWTRDSEDILEQFMEYGPAIFYVEDEDEDEQDVEEEEEDELGDFDEETEEMDQVAGAKKTSEPPSEEEFNEQISALEKTYKKVDSMKSTIPVESWLVLDAAPFKNSLLSIIHHWISSFKQTLMIQKSLGKLRKVEKEDVD